MKRVESSEFDWLSEVLVGRTIIDVEAGTSNGWVLIHLSQTEEEKKKWPEGSRIFLTIKVDGPVEGDAHHWWNAALNAQEPDGGGSAAAIRDHRPAIDSERKRKAGEAEVRRREGARRSRLHPECGSNGEIVDTQEAGEAA